MSTTKISIKRPAVGTDTDPWVVSDDTADTTVTTGIPAVISSPKGGANIVGGAQTDVQFRLNAEFCGLRSTDRVYDEVTEATYEVVWVENRRGLGLDHTVADVRIVTGAATG